MAAILRANEIYRTLLGEGARAGRPCVIVRLTGCNLRCAWCDSTYAYDDGRAMSLDEVGAEVDRLGPGPVLLTGGEPLLQDNARDLLARLCDAGREVLLETNGSLDVAGVDPRVARLVDVKCPGSGEASAMRWSNLDALGAGDEVKFVLADRADFDYAMGVLAAHDLSGCSAVVLTPAAGRLGPAEPARWLLEAGEVPRNVRLGLQLHKIIWPGVRRGV